MHQRFKGTVSRDCQPPFLFSENTPMNKQKRFGYKDIRKIRMSA